MIEATLGVDPGATCGWSLLAKDGDSLLLLGHGQLDHVAFIRWAWAHLVRSPIGMHVAWERYQITSETLRSTRQYEALEVPGALRYKCLELGVPHAAYLRSDAKRFCPDDRLHELGLWAPNCGHANDASRIAILSLAERHKQWYASLPRAH